MALEAFLISTCTLESNTKEKIENMPQNFEFVKARGNFLVQCEEHDNFDYIAIWKIVEGPAKIGFLE